MTLEVTVEDVPEGPLAPEGLPTEGDDSEEGPPPEPPALQRTGSMIHPEADPDDLTQKDPETKDIVEEAPLARKGRKAADPEERAQRKREAQARYYLKKKAALTRAKGPPPERRGATRQAAREESTNKPEPVLQDIEDIPAERSSEASPHPPLRGGATAGRESPEEPQDDPPPPPSPKKPARKAKEPPPTEAPPEAPAQAETIPEIGPPSIRLATPQLRTRALLRRDYEQRAQKFAGLLANGLPK